MIVIIKLRRPTYSQILKLTQKSQVKKIPKKPTWSKVLKTAHTPIVVFQKCIWF